MIHPHPTEQYFHRIHKNGYAADASGLLGSTPYRITRIGFGGYRITDDSREHAMALQKALLYGCNVIDTSSNYTDGGSERLIGRVLGEMQELELLNRDEIMIISKAGYIQGENMRIARERRNSGRGFPELVEYSETCWHCIHPEFLDDQLERSLERLAVEHIDLYLLHNPEYFLLDCKRKGERDLAAIRQIFYQRMHQAFVWMEEQAVRGLIRYYGVSSNTMPAASQDPSFVSLERLLSIAESIAVDHHFRAIQFPLNLYEQGAAHCRNQANNASTLLEFALQRRIGTLVNRPLNSMTDEGLMRLASFRFCDPHQITTDFKIQLAAAGKYEKTFHTDILPHFPAESSAHTAAEFLHLSQLLKSSLHDYKNWLQWDQFRQQYLLTGLSAAFQELNDDLLRDKQWKQWSIDYISAIARLLDTIGLLYESRQQLHSQSLMNSMEELSASMESFPTLSQKSLGLTRSIPGVDCVLVGMRQDRYVDDALAVLHHNAVPDALRILSEFDTTM